MSYAPDDLKAIQAYCKTQTGQPWGSLGIVGDAAHNADGGYHVGVDVLRALGTAPEQPGGDYSYTESPRDRAGLTNGSSAFDLGGDFARFREISLGIVAACQRGDPRTRDVREVIYTPDGRTVRRWDRLGKRSSGDGSHLFHTHVSFHRDAEGRRHADDNFGGLLRELFEGKPTVLAAVDPIQEALMSAEQDIQYMAWRLEGLFFFRDKLAGGPDRGQAVPLVAALKEVQMALAKTTIELVAIKTTMASLSKPVVNVDPAQLAAELVKLLPAAPTAEQNAAEIAKRLGNG